MNNKIFIIEDEEKIRIELSELLNRYGYEANYSNDFENIVEIALESNSHIILLDINLPYYDGYYICREIRKKSNIPIIVVTSSNTQILLARISSLLRRTYQNMDLEIFEFKGLKYNMSISEMEFDNNKVELTKNESRILYTLIKNKEKIVSRNELMKSLWQNDEFVDDNTLTVNINRLRKKLEEVGAVDYLQTKRGQGYILI